MRPIQSCESVTLVEGSSLLVDFSFGEDRAAITNCCKLLTITWISLKYAFWLKSTLKKMLLFFLPRPLLCFWVPHWVKMSVDLLPGALAICGASEGPVLCQPGNLHQGWPAPRCSGLPAAWRVHHNAEGAAQQSSWEYHGGDPAGGQRRSWQGSESQCESQKIKLCCPFVAWQNKIFTMWKIV